MELKKAHPDDSTGVTTCFQTMQKYLANVYRDPSQEKFRNIRVGNPAFQQRVGAFTGSLDILELCGFKVSSLRLRPFIAHCTTKYIVKKFFCATTVRPCKSCDTHPCLHFVGIIATIAIVMITETLRVPVLLFVCLQMSADGQTLSMSQEQAQPDILTTAGSELNNALNNPFFGML